MQCSPIVLIPLRASHAVPARIIACLLAWQLSQLCSRHHRACRYNPARPIATLFRLRGTVLAAIFSNRLEIYLYLLVGVSTFLIDRYWVELPALEVGDVLGLPISARTCTRLMAAVNPRKAALLCPAAISCCAAID